MNEPLPASERPFGQKRLKGRYDLVSLLGQGSLGTTYRAEDRLLQRPVAVKVLAERYTDDGVFRERFMAATAAAGRLVHPNIVTVLDAGVLDGRPFVVMELVDGQSLRARLSERGPLPIGDGQRLARQLADGLAAAHRQRVIHGDIRPENVLIDENGNAKLSDFGFVRAAVTTDVTLLGTVQRATYSPPELALRDHTDERVDVYALAVVVYEMFTGVTPRAGIERRDRPAQIAPIPARRRRPDIPLAMDRALWKALDPDPRERIGSAADLAIAFKSTGMTLTSEAAAATPPPIAASAHRSEPRRRARHGPASESGILTILPMIATLGLIVAAVGSIVYFIPHLFSGLQMTDVPTLSGRPLSEATGIAEANGIKVRVGESIPTDDQPKNMVLTQDPPPDRRVRRGSEVKVTVSAGMRPPSVIGKPVDEARAVLVRAGWNVAAVETRPDANGPSGTVIDMRPHPSEPASDRRQGITLFVAAGNFAAGRPGRLDDGQLMPTEMTDGKPETAGYLSHGAPSWVELDLAQVTTLAAVELTVAQDEPGDTVHEVWAWTTDGQFRGLHTFVGPTKSGDQLSIRFQTPIANVRAVRIATTQAAGRTGWSEIRLLER